MMNKLNFLSRIKSALIIALVVSIISPITFAGGGGATPSLNTKEGLERAADNFLASFALITIDKDIKLKPKGDLAVSEYIMSLNELAYYNYSGSLWNFLLANREMTPLSKSPEVSTEQYQTFIKKYHENKVEEILNLTLD